MSTDSKLRIELRDLTIAYGSFIVMQDINAQIERSQIFLIIGGSGSGKSTVLRVMIGLKEPARGDVYYNGIPFWQSDDEQKQKLLRSFGVMFQQGALWSTMTLAENVALPLGEFTELPPREIQDIARFKLALVGLKGFEDFYPSQISGGMAKRAAIARALALDPEILFFDEPSSGLDPLTARKLDELVLQLRDSLGTTFVVVSHDLESIFAIADNAIFLDGSIHSMRAQGKPKDLLQGSNDAVVREFLTRGGDKTVSPSAKQPAVSTEQKA